LKDLPFHVGDAVEVILLERSRSTFAGEATLKGLGESPSQVEAEKVEEQPESNLYPLRGTVLFYKDSLQPTVPAKDRKPYRPKGK
jgi:hypothetical protein